MLPHNVKPGCGRGRGQPLLTSSVYWTSSTVYFSLKCSLEWILKRSTKKARVRVWPWLGPGCLPTPKSKAHSYPIQHLAPSQSAQHRLGDRGQRTLDHRETAEPRLPPSTFPADLCSSFESVTLAAGSK